MSTQRGNTQRTRSQKYKNRTVFKNDLHDKTPLQTQLNTLQHSHVCQHCKSVLDWKVKYKKYKPLTQPKKCTSCNQRKITRAYHVICTDCVKEQRRCAKCLKYVDEVEFESPMSTPTQEQQLKAEMDRLIKSFSERKRRTFLRYMENGKKANAEVEAELHEEENDNELNKTEKVSLTRVPFTRDELLQKIESMRIAEENSKICDSDDFNSDSKDSDDDDDADVCSDDHDNSDVSNDDSDTIYSSKDNN